MTATLTAPTDDLGHEIDHGDVAPTGAFRAGGGVDRTAAGEVPGEQARACGQPLGLGHVAVDLQRASHLLGERESESPHHHVTIRGPAPFVTGPSGPNVLVKGHEWPNHHLG